MKTHNRIISTLLAVIMLLSSFTALMVVDVSAASGDPDEVIQSTYVKTVFNTPEEKLATMKKAFTRGNHELYVDATSGEVAVKDVNSGNILFTNPYDVASSKGSEDKKKQILSQIVVNYKDVTTSSGDPLYSFEESAMREQIKVLNIKNGIRVEYSIGREESRKLVPRLISDKSFTKFIKTPLEVALANGEIGDEQRVRRVMACYKFESLANKVTQKLKDQLLEDYPVAAKMDIWVFDKTAGTVQINHCETMIKNYCEEYTFEQMDADHAETGYEEEEEKFPLFKMALEYTLDDEGVNVTLPCNGLRYDMSSYTLESVSILPYMGAGHNANTGYNFFPDGAGELFDFEKLSKKTQTNIVGQIYGADYAYHQIKVNTDDNQKIIRYPVYGTVAEEVLHTFTYSSPVYELDKNGKPVLDPSGKPTAIDRENITTTISNTVVKKDEIEEYLAEFGGTLLTDVTTESYKRGYVAIIEAGESLGKLETSHVPAMTNYNTMINYFNPKPKDSYDLADSLSVSSSSSWTVVSDRKYTGNITISYQMLTDKKVAEKIDTAGYTYYDATWFGMAEAYRDHLVKNGTLTKLTAEDLTENIPLYMEVFGVVETQEQIATIPMDVMTPLTTYENIITMYNELSEVGVKNINFKMTGFANGGLGMQTVPASLKWEKNVGGAKGFRELVEKAAAINATKGEKIGLYPDFDFAYVENNTLFDSTNLKKDAVKTIDNRYSSKRQYSSTSQAYVSFYQLAISPSRYSKFYTKLLANYEEYNLKSLSIGSLGSALNSDFDEDEPYNREDNKSYTMQAFEDMKNAGYSLMTESANAYTWGYVDHLINMDLDSSRHIKASASVPFIGVVLHGYVQFAGTPFNEEGDTDYAMLRALENGASLYFILSYQNTSKLKEFPTLSQYYSVRYDIWKEDVISYYKELNELLKDVQDKIIIDHQFLTGDRVLDLDELEAELEELLKEAAKLEKEEQQAIITERVLKIATAWKVAENAVDTVEDILEEMDTINANMEYSAKSLNEMIGTLDSEVETALMLMRPGINETTGEIIEPLAPGQAARNLITTLNSLRSITTGILQQKARLQQLYDEGTAMLAQVSNSAAIIQDSDLDATVKANMIASINEYLADATALFENAEKGAAVKLVVNDALVTVGSDKYVVDIAVNALAAVKADDPTEHANLLGACEDANALYTAERLLEEGKLTEEKEDDDKNDTDEGTTSDRFVADNNRIAIVTYGDRDPETFAKVAYKSFILNYNNYSVVVEYEGVVYTIPSGGYVVIYH